MAKLEAFSRFCEIFELDSEEKHLPGILVDPSNPSSISSQKFPGLPVILIGAPLRSTLTLLIQLFLGDSFYKNRLHWFQKKYFFF